MIWLLDLCWHWNERRKLAKALRRRKAARIVEQQRAKQAYWASRRKQWASDPMRGAADV